MMLRLFLFFSLWTVFELRASEAALQQLDRVLDERDHYVALREAELTAVRAELVVTVEPVARFTLLGELFEANLAFNADSAYRYAGLRYSLATEQGREDWRTDALLDRVAVYNATGLYKEAVDLLAEAEKGATDVGRRLRLFYLSRSLYESLSRYVPFASEQAHYEALRVQYRDSVLKYDVPSASGYVMAAFEVLAEQGDYAAALRLLQNDAGLEEGGEHHRAIVYHLMGNAFLSAGEADSAVHYLALSSVSDLKSAVKEYISLWQLAGLLYERGDVDRAYRYVQTSLDDATAGNARLRTIGISRIYPLIEGAYRSKIAGQQQQLRRFLLAIALLALVLVVAVVLVGVQLKRLRRARKALSVLNVELERTNRELRESNRQLQEMNRLISDSSMIKEEYIGRYMEQCSLYLKKLEDYRSVLKKTAQTGGVKALQEAVKAYEGVDADLEEFYRGFDETFLRLFPSFVEDFNALLHAPERIELKPGERLNTELRIFALIRLGISDSEKIAHFLRYSVSTIYNYRTRTRNKAAGDRGLLEAEVLKIGLDKA